MDFTGLLSTLGDIIKNKHLCFLTIEIRNHRNHQRLQVLFWLRFGTHRSRSSPDPGGAGCREPTSWPWFDAAAPRGGEPMPGRFVVSVSWRQPTTHRGAPSPQWQLQLVPCFFVASFRPLFVGPKNKKPKVDLKKLEVQNTDMKTGLWGGLMGNEFHLSTEKV